MRQVFDRDRLFVVKDKGSFAMLVNYQFAGYLIAISIDLIVSVFASRIQPGNNKSVFR